MRAGRRIRKKVSLLLLILELVGGVTGCSSHEASNGTNRNESAPAPSSSASARVISAVGFASREKLVEHYRKHGREFGNVSMEEYLQKAQELRDHSLDETVVEAARKDGVITRFARDTGTFIAFGRDGVIRTCFKPNDGESYFRRQLKRDD